MLLERSPSRTSGKTAGILQSSRRGQLFAAALVALAILGPGIADGRADNSHLIRLAQQEKPQIRVAPAIVAQPGSQISLPIAIEPLEALPSRSFIRVRGLPHLVSLSEGYSVGPGMWAIPISALGRLRATVPAGVGGRSQVVIMLVSFEGAPLAEANTVLNVVSPTPSSGAPAAQEASEAGLPTAVLASPARRSVVPRPPELSLAARQRAEELIAQGERYFAEGKIGGARLLFRQAADAGLALAAIRLAATYDPTELARLQTQGITPDAAEARRWYERARALGAPEAEERLARLGAN